MLRHYKDVPPPMISILRETHDVPEGVARSLELAGGSNRFREPTYRAIWGRHRMVAPPSAFSREARPVRSRAAARTRLRRLGVRLTRRCRPGVSQTTFRFGAVTEDRSSRL